MVYGPRSSVGSRSILALPYRRSYQYSWSYEQESAIWNSVEAVVAGHSRRDGCSIKYAPRALAVVVIQDVDQIRMACPMLTSKSLADDHLISSLALQEHLQFPSVQPASSPFRPNDLSPP